MESARWGRSHLVQLLVHFLVVFIVFHELRDESSVRESEQLRVQLRGSTRSSRFERSARSRASDRVLTLSDLR